MDDFVIIEEIDTKNVKVKQLIKKAIEEKTLAFLTKKAIEEKTLADKEYNRLCFELKKVNKLLNHKN